MAGLQALSGVALGAGPLMFLGAGATGATALWQVHAVDLDSKSSCLRAFKSNAALGWLPFTSFTLDRLAAPFL